MKKLQEKLDFLLNKYSVEANAELKDKNTVIINQKEYPLLSHRFARKFEELKKIVTGGTLVGISVMRTARIVGQDCDVYNELLREADLCQYILQREIKSITAMLNDNVLNAVAVTDDGVVCTIEISATLSREEPAKEKHEIISQRGIACDIVVDAQLKQDSVYVFGKENKKYTDVDFELYGLSEEEIAVVRAAFKLVQTRQFEDAEKAYLSAKKIVECARKSILSGEREEI